MEAEKERLIQRYRKQSPILTPAARNPLNFNPVEGMADNLKAHLALIVGGSEQPDCYYDPQRGYTLGKLPELRLMLKSLDKRIKDWFQEQQGYGNNPVAVPENLKEERLKIEAKIVIAEQEVVWLQDELAKIPTKGEEEPPCLAHKRMWGVGELRGGILHRIGGQLVGPGEDGVLMIIDQRSKYCGLPVWRFKSEVLKAKGLEWNRRLRQEEDEAYSQNRKRNPVEFPADPILNRETGTIEYPGYSNETMRKLKKNND